MCFPPVTLFGLIARIRASSRVCSVPILKARYSLVSDETHVPAHGTCVLRHYCRLNLPHVKTLYVDADVGSKTTWPKLRLKISDWRASQRL